MTGSDIYGRRRDRQSAERVRDVVRTADIACRVGGDEFAVILPESTLADATSSNGAFRPRCQHADRAGRTALVLGRGG